LGEQLLIVLVDTHVFAWSLDTTEGEISAPARAAMAEAERLLVSTVSFYEIAQKVRLGKWPAMSKRMDGLVSDSRRMGYEIAPLSVEMSIRAGLLEMDNRDPFDRMLAATALTYDAILLTKDERMHEYAGRWPDLKVMW